ncbi:MAG: biotin/lipoyl-binding protein, partial [Pseudomonadota bacterium]
MSTKTDPRDQHEIGTSIHRNLIAGVAVIAFLAGGLGFWLGTMELSGAVVAGGKLVVESNVKKVQHADGGIVGELLVEEGDHVDAGQVLMRLDATQTEANLAIVEHALDEFLAKEARLEAERDDLAALTFSDLLQSRQDRPEVQRIMKAEQRLFGLRLTSREGEKAQLKERAEQLQDEIKGLEEQTVAKRKEINLISEELVGVRKLWEKDLVQISRLNALERDAARLEGEHEQLIAAIAQAKGRIAEVELKIIQVDQNLRSE